MKKLVSLFLLVSLLLTLTACGPTQSDPPPKEEFKNITFENVIVHYTGNEHKVEIKGTLPEGTTVTYENNTATEEGTYDAKVTLRKGEDSKVLTAKLIIVEPSAEQVVLARTNTVNQSKQSFDYQYKLTGELSLLGFTGAVDGIYTGQYREDKQSGDFVFKRTTSGELLLDSTKYVYGKGNQLITLKANDDNTIKKVCVETVDEQAETFVHKPIESLVNNISKDDIEKITISSDVPGYKYKAHVKFSSENPHIQRLLDAVSNLGSTISFKDVEIPNLANGIQLYFNYGADNRIEDFFISINISFPVKAATASITLSYGQFGTDTAVQIPQDDTFIINDEDINTLVNEFNTTMLALKNSPAYSLDVTAKNDFDPAWNVTATVDQYQARLYKNTNGTDVYFNHSYKYKAHHEEDGAETYKYTLGNIIGEDAGVYLVTRVGRNTVSPVETTYSADTQFDFLASMALINPANVDCIKRIENGTKTTYRFHLNKAAVLDIQNKILTLINSNDAEDVVEVNNYFNAEDYIFEDATVEIVLENGVLTTVVCKTETHYTPTGGDYTEYNATLKNTIEIKINNKLSDAQDYTAPSSTGIVIGIGSFVYYIL